MQEFSGATDLRFTEARTADVGHLTDPFFSILDRCSRDTGTRTTASRVTDFFGVDVYRGEIPASETPAMSDFLETSSMFRSGVFATTSPVNSIFFFCRATISREITMRVETRSVLFSNQRIMITLWWACPLYKGSAQRTFDCSGVMVVISQSVRSSAHMAVWRLSIAPSFICHSGCLVECAPIVLLVEGINIV